MNYDRAEWRMERRRHRSGSNGVFLGGLIVAVGLLLLLDNMHVIRMRDVWEFWPVLLIAFGLARIVESHTPSSLVWGGMVALVGALLLLDNLDIILFDFSFIWPLLLIAFGVSMLWRSLERRRYAETGGVVTDRALTITAIFSGAKRKLASPDLKRVDVLALFGGCVLDLRDAKIEGSAIVDVNAMFGGVDILVPETWTITGKAISILGGFDDKTLPPRVDPNTPPPRLIVSGVAMFGGISVRNKVA